MRLLLLLLAACATTPEPRLLGADLAVPGHVARFYGATECQTSGNVLPWIHTTTTPRADTWFSLTGTRGTTPLTTDPPIEAWWLIAHERLLPSFTTFFAPGCELTVNFFAALRCLDRDPTKPLPLDVRTAAWREGPTAFLVMLPVPELVGRSIYIQLAIQAPGENFVGVLISHGVELWVGG